MQKPPLRSQRHDRWNRSRSKFVRATSSISPTLAGLRSISSRPAQVEAPAAAAMSERGQTCAAESQRVEGFIVQEMVDRPERIRADRRHDERSDLRPGHPVRARRDGCRNHQRSIARVAAAQFGHWHALLSNGPVLSALLKGYRDRPPSDIDGVVNVLVQLSRIVAEHAEIFEIDINPLLCDPSGVIAVDGRIRVHATAASAQSRLAIRPYPAEA